MTGTSTFTVTADTPVNAETIRRALEADQEFEAYPQYVRDGVLAMAPDMPAALDDWLDKPATIENVARAKMAFIRLCLEKGFVEKLVQAMPQALIKSSGYTLEEIGEQMRSAFQDIVEQGDEMVAQLVAQMKAMGMDDVQVIQQNPELPDSVKKAQREGWLTVGKMLLLFPPSITKNDRE